MSDINLMIGQNVWVKQKVVSINGRFILLCRHVSSVAILLTSGVSSKIGFSVTNMETNLDHQRRQVT